MQDLEKQLRRDLLKIGLNEDFKLSLKPYSKTYFGRYTIQTNTVTLYVNETPNGVRYPYIDLLLTTIHEVIHCKQWHDPNFVRLKGVMHDPEFKKLYDIYSNRARALLLFKEVKKSFDTTYKKNVRETHDQFSVCGA